MTKAAAILLGIAGALAPGIPAQALTIRPLAPLSPSPNVSAKVVPILKEAQSLVGVGNYKAAMIMLNKAETVKSTSDDKTIIDQMRRYIEVKAAEVSLRGPYQSQP